MPLTAIISSVIFRQALFLGMVLRMRLVFIMFSFWSLSIQCGLQSDHLTINQQTISTTAIYDGETNDSFLHTANLNELPVRIYELSKSAISDSFCLFVPRECDPEFDVYAFFSFSREPTPSLSINSKDVFGVLAIYTRLGVPKVGFFRGSNDSEPELEIDLEGGIFFDLLYVLHMESLKHLDLSSSTIYGFLSPLSPEILDAISLDQEHSFYGHMIKAGTFEYGLSFSSFYHGALTENPGPVPGHCGQNALCPPGNRRCNALAGFVCETPGPCFSENYNQAIQENAYSLDFLDLPFLRAFRDDFLRLGPCSSRFLAYYYQFSPLMKLDFQSMLKYAQVFPKITEAANKLRGDNTSAIILTSDLYNDLLELIDMHRDVEDDAFQIALDELIVELDKLKNRTAHEVEAILYQ